MMLKNMIFAVALASAAALEDRDESTKTTAAPRIRGATRGATLRATRSVDEQAAIMNSKLSFRDHGRQLHMSYHTVTPPEPLRVLVADHKEYRIFMSSASDGGAVADTVTNFWEDDAKTKNIQSVRAGRDGYVFACDFDAKGVYKIRDTDGDGVVDEVIDWFTAGNEDGRVLRLPTDAWETEDAVYIVHIGQGSEFDGIYATEDLNGDGDADDAGESRVWLELLSSSPWKIEFIGNVAFVYDYGSTSRIWRAEDKNGDGIVDPASDELEVYVNSEDFPSIDFPFGASVAMDGPDALVLAQYPSEGLYRVNAADKTAELIWDQSTFPGEVAGFDLKLHRGEIWITNSYPFPCRVVRLVDTDGDGKFDSEGEAEAWLTYPTEGQPRDCRPRAVEAWGEPGVP